MKSNIHSLKFKKAIVIMCVLIMIFSALCSIIGIISKDTIPTNQTVSVFGESVELYGKGIYKYNSVSIASQGIASDWVTLIIGVPLLCITLFFWYKGKIKWHLMLIGIVAYFAYTYISYVFLWFYNPLFIVYVILMSLSLNVLVLLIAQLDITYLKDHTSFEVNIKWVGIIQLLVGGLIGAMWLSIILPSILTNTPPIALEHYTTLVIQALDLGIVIPLAFTSGILLIKKNIWGYVLSPIILTKGATMLLAMFAMLVNMLLNGIEVSLIQLILIPVFCVLFILANIKVIKLINI